MLDLETKLVFIGSATLASKNLKMLIESKDSEIKELKLKLKMPQL